MFSLKNALQIPSICDWNFNRSTAIYPCSYCGLEVESSANARATTIRWARAKCAGDCQSLYLHKGLRKRHLGSNFCRVCTGMIESTIFMFEDLERKISYTFRNKDILLRALTHRSFSHENSERMIRDNETLEFLGDSILGFIISEFLFLSYSHQYTEGLMSKVKSYIISTEILSMKARDI